MNILVDSSSAAATVGAAPTVSSAVAVNADLQKEKDKMVEQGEGLTAQSSSGGVRKDEKVRGVIINLR